MWLVEVRETTRLPARVHVDPNRARGARVVARFDECSRLVKVGEPVIAVEEEDEGPDFVTSALVEHVDPDARLVTLEVNWAGMQEEPQAPMAAIGPHFEQYVYWGQTGGSVVHYEVKAGNRASAELAPA